jgi:hypothetical protein
MAIPATEIGGTLENIKFCKHTLHYKAARGLAFVHTYSFAVSALELIYSLRFI